MKALLSASMRGRGAVLFLAWAAAFWGLLHEARYQTFLRPEFGGILAAAGGMSLLLFLAELGRRHQAPLSIGSLFGPAILLMPLLYLINAQGAELDGAVFEKRTVRAPRDLSQAQAPAPEPEASSAPVVEVDESEVLHVTHLDLHRAFRQYEGKTVSLVGMARPNDPVLRDFGPRALLVFRFIVSCCAADAQPIAVAVVPRPGQPSFPDSTWVSVRGRFTTRVLPGGRVPLVEGAVVSQTTAPKPPYLY